MDELRLEKMSIKKNELLRLLSDYYLNKYNKNIKVKCKVEEKFDFTEQLMTVISFYYEDTIKFNNVNVDVTCNLSKEDIVKILNELLIEEGYEIKNIEFKTYTKTTGYYLSERDEVYFSGVDFSLSKKPMEKILRKGNAWK